MNSNLPSKLLKSPLSKLIVKNHQEIVASSPEYLR